MIPVTPHILSGKDGFPAPSQHELSGKKRTETAAREKE